MLDDTHRPDLQHTRLIIGAEGRAFLVATDGHALIELDVSPDAGDEAGAVPTAALREARVHATKDRAALALREGRAEEPTSGTSWRRPPPPKPFDYATHAFPFAPTDPDVVTVALNPKLLLHVAEALGCKTMIRLSVRRGTGGDSLEPTLVTVPSLTDRRAALMPMQADPAKVKKPKRGPGEPQRGPLRQPRPEAPTDGAAVVPKRKPGRPRKVDVGQELQAARAKGANEKGEG